MKLIALFLVFVLMPGEAPAADDGLGTKIENLGKKVRKTTEKVVDKTSQGLKHAGKKTAQGLDTAGTKTSEALHNTAKTEGSTRKTQPKTSASGRK